MRIEKINENQIRCTLTKSDLEEHQVLLNELAFGTDHAKDLFRDMMAQASEEFGFEADDIPLMIEAVPVSPDKLVLIITKMENPDELDEHFSKYMKHFDLSEDPEEDSLEDINDETETFGDSAKQEKESRLSVQSAYSGSTQDLPVSGLRIAKKKHQATKNLCRRHIGSIVFRHLHR